MRKLLLIAILLGLTTGTMAQQGKALHNYKVHTTWEEQHPNSGALAPSSHGPFQSHPMLRQAGDTNLLGRTTYDLQTNNSLCRRIVDLGNGELAATWTMSRSFDLTANDRGTGYNYFDGNAWQVSPQNTNRIENTRTGWSNVGFTGNREYVISHTSDNGMNFAYRDQVGSGNWQNKLIPNDPEAVWPRAANMGDTIFVIVSRSPPTQGSPAPLFNGVEGGLALHRTYDGGDSWIGPDTIDGLNSNNFAQIGGDTYAIDANEQSGVVAFVVGFPQPTLFKSTDFGDTWQRTPLIDVANPKYTGETGQTIDSTVTTDESFSILVDNNGKSHVFYGRNVIVDDDPNQEGWQFFPINAGIMYWNEYMGTDQEPKRIWETAPAAEQLGLCQWGLPQGANMDWANAYFQNIVSMPQAGMDNNGDIYLSYASMRSGIFNQQGNPVNLSNSNILFSNTFIIKSTNQGQDWMGPVNVSQDSTREAVYGSLPRYIRGDSIPIVYQTDPEPGTSVQDQAPGDPTFGINDIVVTNIYKNNINNPTDITCPTITNQLNPGETAESFLNCPVDKRSFLRATDVPEGIITDQIQFVNGIDSSQLGMQTDSAFVMDNAGNVSDTIEVTVNIIQDTVPPSVSLNGFDTLDILKNSTYNDAGVTVDDNSTCTINVNRTGSVDSSTIGTYTITFVATDGSGNSDSTTRVVNVIGQDTEPPQITLNGNDTMTVEACANFNDPGATAFDNLDLALTDSIQVSGNVNVNQPGNYTLTYSVTDSSGNTATKMRMVKVVDTTPPDLTLQGNPTMKVCLGSSFNDPGATASDCVDGNLDSQVSSDANTAVNVNQRDTYTVEYTVTDNAGNQAGPITRQVEVNTEPDAQFGYTLQPNLTVSFTDSSLHNPNDFTWSFGDQTQSIAQNPSHTYSSPGTFTVCLEVENDFNGPDVCNVPADSICEPILVQPTGIAEATLDAFVNVYPNPTNGKVNIDLEKGSGDNATIKVVDVLGKTYLEKEEENLQGSSQLVLDLGEFADGLYFISIKTEEGAVTKKINVSNAK